MQGTQFLPNLVGFAYPSPLAAEKDSASANKSLSTSSLEFTQGGPWRLWEFETLN